MVHVGSFLLDLVGVGAPLRDQLVRQRVDGLNPLLVHCDALQQNNKHSQISSHNQMHPAMPCENGQQVSDFEKTLTLP